ncbi:MAG TPA: GNAT family N-acetyltransferase, partial [Steroidobacteraceae bacterium]|nr:GNAT family N-acetyltransferase [Steroidobacteraceae bacterium]
SVVDAPGIASLSNELGYEATAEMMAARITTLLKRDDHHLIVAVVDDEVAGWIHVCASTSLESGFRAEIVGLVVGSSFRRIGIGKMLVEDAIRWSREHGADVLVVRSNVIREESHQFYPSVGFEQTKTQAVYRMCLR